jgi:putative hydrolase of the HAD superfamily
MVTSFTLSYEVGVVKPDRRIFVTACEAIAVEPEDVLMVGDDPRSDGGSVDAGIRALLLPPRQQGSDNGLRSVLDLVVGDAGR